MAERFNGITVTHSVEKHSGYVNVNLNMSLANFAKLIDNTSREYSQFFTDRRESIKAATTPEVLADQDTLPGL